MKKVAAVLTVAALAACSGHTDGPNAEKSSGAAKTRSIAGSGDASAMGAADRGWLLRARPGAARAFASQPDRGDLVAYPAARTVRRDGAYTWHRADLSEAHALAAINGTLNVTAPNGEQLSFEYERHVEHDSGDWTWVGRLRGGSASDEVVLTFGEQGAFGTIGQRSGQAPLRLTVSGGRSWLVETDTAREPTGSGLRDDGRDYLVPPSAVSSTVAAAAAPSVGNAQAASADSTKAAGQTTIDVAVGFTSGYATGLGGSSAATTRINNLVEITNQAYSNSQVNARVRLVHSRQVDFPDNTDNGDALEKLSGYKSGSGPITVDSRFNALRSARDQYGADLVVLVRDFNTPENDGCGIAWLIGGARSGVETGDAPFGYSVVSDGQDQGSDGKTYFCRDETFAHELGHNMGLQHDRDTADGDDNTLQNDEYGVAVYSFGYKTTVNGGNFYDIMAYGDTGQTGYRVFSNPSITFCGGRACGVADQADNARALRATIPTVAAFRAVVVPLASSNGGLRSGDFNGDGTDDLMWRNLSSGANQIWRSANSATQTAVTTVATQAWSVVGIGDFDADGKDDLLWRNSSSGANTIWRSANSATQLAVATVGSQAWSVNGVGDFNGDGKSDILWRNGTTGANNLWLSGSSSTQQALTTVANTAWSVAGIGDLNGDGKDDIVWRNGSTGANQAWASGNSSTQIAMTAASGGWAIVGVGDFDEDGKHDVFWRNASTGANTIWRSGNSATQISVSAVSNLAWRVRTIGDFDNDGRDDVMWRNDSTGANLIWNGGTTASQRTLTTVANAAWSIP